MRILYQLLLVLVRPFVRIRLWWRGRRAPAYAQRISERYGHIPKNIPQHAVWVHTVSAGETIAAAPLIRRLIAGFGEQNTKVLVTTMTPTGSAEVQRLFGDSVAHCYAPYDFPDAVQRFVSAVKPRALILMETELWPNLIEHTAATNAPVMLVNARMSERSARGYARIGGLITPLLRRLAWVGCQFDADARRLRQLGLSGAQLEVTGSIKFDVSENEASAEQQLLLRSVKQRLGLTQRPVWVAGSTHAGEDEVILAAHQQLTQHQPNACLLLVPRHPERFDEVAQLSRRSFATLQLSELDSATASNPSDSCAVLVVDVMGLLQQLYALAGVAFVGGSLAAAGGGIGGHNPIEPAAAGVPVLMGPERFNFVGVCDLFVAAGCLEQVSDTQELSDALARLLGDEVEREAQGARAQAVVAEHAGATDYLVERLTGVIAKSGAQ